MHERRHIQPSVATVAPARPVISRRKVVTQASNKVDHFVAPVDQTKLNLPPSARYHAEVAPRPVERKISLNLFEKPQPQLPRAQSAPRMRQQRGSVFEQESAPLTRRTSTLHRPVAEMGTYLAHDVATTARPASPRRVVAPSTNIIAHDSTITPPVPVRTSSPRHINAGTTKRVLQPEVQDAVRPLRSQHREPVDDVRNIFAGVNTVHQERPMSLRTKIPPFVEERRDSPKRSNTHNKVPQPSALFAEKGPRGVCVWDYKFRMQGNYQVPPRASTPQPSVTVRAAPTAIVPAAAAPEPKRTGRKLFQQPPSGASGGARLIE